jgi:hypothetical protein
MLKLKKWPAIKKCFLLDPHEYQPRSGCEFCASKRGSIPRASDSPSACNRHFFVE